MRSRRALALLLVTALLPLLAGRATAAGVYLPTPPVGPPTYTVNTEKSGLANGDIFYTTGFSAAEAGPDSAVGPVVQEVDGQTSSAVVADRSGKTLWSHTAPDGQSLNNFREQRLDGRTVLTWWQGTVAGGHGVGTDYIANARGTVVRTIRSLGARLAPDTHEFRIVSGHRALITAYKLRTGDLSSMGGPSDASFYDCYAVVYDLRTGRVLKRWDAYRHVPVAGSYVTQPLPGTSDYDPYHLNSIALDPQGNLVLSMRSQSAVFDVDMRSGRVRWQLGGKAPTIASGPGVEFAYQHDAEFTGATTLRLFNDNSNGTDSQGYSSVEWIHLDPTRARATLVRSYTHPDDLVSMAMGNAQGLPNGDSFVSWGAAPRISEFSPTGELLYDASLPSGSYRAYVYRAPPGLLGAAR